jgi:hypothetical protein
MDGYLLSGYYVVCAVGFVILYAIASMPPGYLVVIIKMA